MEKNIRKLLSVVLVLVMLFNMIPLNAFAAETTTQPPANTTGHEAVPHDVYIMEEIIEERSEYIKQFRMSNGLQMAAVYASSVHYEENGRWEEIDNTLQLAATRSGNAYVNTAGDWQVSFPQNMTGDNSVTITKDGYVFTFRMYGEILNPVHQGIIEDSEIIGIHDATEATTDVENCDEEMSAVSEIERTETSEADQEVTEDISAESSEEHTEEVQETDDANNNMAIVSAPAENVAAEIEVVDMEAVKATSEYPETVIEKTNSRLSYKEIYEDTDIIFDLKSNQVKESIIMKEYRDALKGYVYTLEVGEMIPVLMKTGEIELRSADGEETIMYMPAPYLIDDAGDISFNINVSLEGENGKYILAYELPQDWLSSEDRQWPVVLDPAVYPDMDVGNIRDITVYDEVDAGNGVWLLQCGEYRYNGLGRTFLKYNELPILSSADVIVSATAILHTSSAAITTPRVVEVHKVEDVWYSERINWSNKPDYDEQIEDYQVCGTPLTDYQWDITDIVRGWYAGENTGMMFKLDTASELAAEDYIEFYASDHSAAYEPAVVILFRNNNGLENYWDYTSASAGRAGVGYVNQYSGNLIWTRNDIGFGGNLMPVSISHIYNSNNSTENLFGMGNGWRTNFNQKVCKWNHQNALGEYFVWEDADGTNHYFYYVSENTYKDEDGLELTLTTNINNEGTQHCITDKYGNTSCFDAEGRLIRQSNFQNRQSSITISYTETPGDLISTITDGAGRVYTFTYDSNNLLSKITYKGKGNSEITYVKFGYTNSNLTSVTDKDGMTSWYTYTTNNLLTTAQDIDGYKICYDYTTTAAGLPNRIMTVSEYSGTTPGGVLDIEYAHNQTKMKDYNGNVQIVQFNNMGNTISVQDDEGRAQYARYAINNPTVPNDDLTNNIGQSNTAKSNQLLLASKLQYTVDNIVKDSSFENDIVWSSTNSTYASCEVTSDESYLGNKSLKITHDNSNVEAGAGSPVFTIEPGETYTLSGYVKTGTATAYLAIGSSSAGYHRGERIPANPNWTRVEYSYTNNTTTAQSVHAFFLTTGEGTTYVDCVQVEKAPTASRYNLIQNSDFEYPNYAWDTSTGRTTVTADNEVPATQLDANVYMMTGNPTCQNRISQTVNVSGEDGTTFVLAGWAKADSVPIKDDREFALIATFKNGGTTVNTSVVRFNDCADSTIEWQYVASPVVAMGAFDSIVIELAYDYNANTAYFDGVQLYAEEFGNSYTYDANGNVVSVKDVLGQITTYEYTGNDLTKQTLPSGVSLTYHYDGYHNVVSAVSENGVVYFFGYDLYGNNTSVYITSGTVSLISSATYTPDGNRLYQTKDTSGKVTTYNYNENTNILEWVKYPKDTDSTRTEYTYDDMYRLAKTEVDVNTGSTLRAEYQYTNDLLTSIKTQSTTYSFTYGAFALRSSIKIGNRALALYGYTDRNNYLKVLMYGNGGSVNYTYDKQGRVTKETFENSDTVTYKYDNRGALASVTDSATDIITNYYYDHRDRLMRYAEAGSDYSHIVSYEYDQINNLTALVETVNGTEHRTTYAYDDDNRVTSVVNGSASEAYTYDAYSRLSKKITKNGNTTVLTDNFIYRAPNTSTTSTQIAILKSTAPGYNVDYMYNYDDNGNILSVSDGTFITSYVYDSANQLIRENNQAAGKTWVWTYDDAGNILSKKEYAYTTGTLGSAQSTVNYTYDATWGDLLTKYANKNITSDTIGNMLFDGTWTYTWEHGRELATMSNGNTTWAYTYNADGLRTKRTNGSTTYNYIYNGSRLSQMTVGSNTLCFAYDASGIPMSLTYNGTYYYYATNLQGDITAILNSSGTAVVQYTYDAWGRILTTTGSMASTLGAHNPLRYRGYVYDTETTLYYLQSRFYNPEQDYFIPDDMHLAYMCNSLRVSFIIFISAQNYHIDDVYLINQRYFIEREM